MKKTPAQSAPDDIRKMEKMAVWLDSRFSIPGTSIRFGLDSILGLIPGIGDTVTLASTAYLIRIARTHNLPLYVIIHMLWNAFVDWFIGLVPLLGDIFDVGWKANLKNVALIKKHLEPHISTEN
jgi:hypothetical protein